MPLKVCRKLQGHFFYSFKTKEEMNMRTNNTKQFSEKSSIFYWMDKLIYYKRQSGKDSTADLYRATRNWLYRFIHRRNLSVFQITSSLIDNFVNYLKRLGHLRMNSINSYLSGFRAMYNHKHILSLFLFAFGFHKFCRLFA